MNTSFAFVHLSCLRSQLATSSLETSANRSHAPNSSQFAMSSCKHRESARRWPARGFKSHSVRPLDRARVFAFVSPIISPVVSTPGARPPQGGLCYVRTALVWRTDEKGSDVNLATQLLVDGFDNAYDCAVLVTNDSDLLGPIRVVRHRLGKRVGLLNPQQRPARALQGEAHLYKQIRSGVLAASQFPLTLTDANGTFTKPATW